MEWPSKDWRDFQDGGPNGAHPKSSNRYALSLRECFVTFLVLVPILVCLGYLVGASEPIGGGVLYSALLTRVIDWIVQGYRKSAAGEPA